MEDHLLIKKHCRHCVTVELPKIDEILEPKLNYQNFYKCNAERVSGFHPFVGNPVMLNNCILIISRNFLC